MFQNVKPVTLFSSLKSLTFRLWDEQRHKLVGYRHLREMLEGKMTSGSQLTSRHPPGGNG
jgi:omega-6 fatty acid desaturase (delta-12 desaturase)